MYATASAKPPLLRNPLFDEWSAGQPTQWDHTTTNATYSQLQKTDPLSDPARAIFREGMKRSDADYIYAGENGFRITMASGAAANDWIIRQNAASSAGNVARPEQHGSVRIAARCSVAGNLLNVQVIGLVGTTDTFFLAPVGGTYFKGRTGFEWVGTSTTIPLTMLTLWQVWGLEIPSFPLDIDSVSVRAANGSAGAQVIDMGEFAMVENVSMLGGAG